MKIQTTSGYIVEDVSNGIDVHINGRYLGEIPYTSLGEYELDGDDVDSYYAYDEVTGETFYYDDMALEKKIESYFECGEWLWT